jgi:hypothetical protein
MAETESYKALSVDVFMGVNCSRTLLVSLITRYLLLGLSYHSNALEACTLSSLMLELFGTLGLAL